MQFLQRLSIVAAMLVGLAGIPAVQAQDDGPDYNYDILNCRNGDGCSYEQPGRGLPKARMEQLVGEEDESGNGLLVCTSNGCSWSEINMSEVDLIHGGDGEPEGAMYFHESEVEPIDVDEVGLGEGFIFDESDVTGTNIVPRDGQWTTYHEAGQMVCPGGITLEIPAGDVTTGTLSVLDDGAMLHGEDLDPETDELDMPRRMKGVYGAELTLTVEGGTMIMYWEQIFVSETMAIGLIHGQFEQQGMTCTVMRPFHAMHEGGIQIEEDGDQDMPYEQEDDSSDLVS